MNGFERRKEQKKESIRRAALELFKLYGTKKVSISEIAARAGVSQVTIYNHFGSKEELVRDTVKTLLLGLIERYRVMIEGEQPFLEKLEQIVLDKSELARQYSGEFLQTAISNDPEIEQFIESIYRNEINQRMLDFFEEGKKQGYVNRELSQEAILVYTDIFRRGVMASYDILADSEHYERLVKELMSIYLYGVIGRAERVR